jgi:Cytochrome c7 and related cytochrome c
MPLRPGRAGGFVMLVLVASIALRAQGPAVPATPAPEQPLPYSHKTHLALGLQCQYCHVNPDMDALMTFPATATCMECHAKIAADRPSLRALSAFAASGETIPWVRVYKLPDYVYWQHGTHLAAEVACAECHGPVAERDVIGVETNITRMAGCMSCHNRQQVFTDCGDCHAPRQ